MKNLFLRLCLVALGLLAASPSFAQTKMPGCLTSNNQGVSCTGVVSGATTYPLLTAATPATASTPPAGTYKLLLPATFNGATVTLSITSANGTVSTFAYTSVPSPVPCFPIAAGDTVSAAASGGTPTGNTVFAGATRCGSGDVSPPPILIASTTPAAWATGSTAQDVRRYGSATIQVEGLSGGDTIAVTGSLSGNGYAALTGLGADFSTVTAISTDGIYSYDGGQYLKWAKTGSASTPALTIRAGE